MPSLTKWLYTCSQNIIFAETQDLREHPLHPGLTVGETSMNTHEDDEA